jgi:putative membrane protein
VTGPGEHERLDIDIRFLLANERTLLAWLRTGLTLLAGGVALAQFARDHSGLWLVGIGLLLLGAIAGVVGYLRYRVNLRAIRAGGLPPPGSGPILVTAGVVGMALALLMLYLFTQPRV